jgi:glucose/mannose-6-phosphate isomerase
LTSLDDHEAVAGLDSLGVLAAVEGFAAQIERGWFLGSAVAGLPDAAGLDSVVVLGMGGSAAAGDVVLAVTEDRSPVPVVVHKGYGPLPEWVGRNTLVVGISYSGNTEETLTTFEEAHGRGARLVSIASGGTLASIASGFGAAHIEVPGGTQPRAALGYLAMPLLAVLEGVGLVPTFDDDVAAASALISNLAGRYGRTTGAGSNPAKELATKLHEKVPVVYGGRGLGAAIASRFKNDVNEYAKAPAFYNVLPEADHNEICAWAARSGDAPFVGVMVRDEDDHPRVAARFDITARIIEDSGAEVIDLRTEEGAPVVRILATLYLTQLTAIYLAILRGVDPGPVAAIDRLKSELAALEGAKS